MVEGDGEVISSARTPSMLHGRIGMTIKFSELDAPSKIVLVELEKARLAMKPLPPSVPPRPVELPPTPRPVPPAPGGRIDLRNALAECVAIGDLDGLGVAVARPGPKFVVPTIPPVAGGRPRAPAGPEIGAFAKATDTGPTRAVDTGRSAQRDPHAGDRDRAAADAGAVAQRADHAPPSDPDQRAEARQRHVDRAGDRGPDRGPDRCPDRGPDRGPIEVPIEVPIDAERPPTRPSDTVVVVPAPRATPMPLERGGPLSATMEVAIGDVTGANAALDPLDDVIPPPQPAGVIVNDQSGVTTVAPPPQPVAPVPPQPVQQAPEDLLTTIRSPRPPQMDMLATMRSSAPPMPPIVGHPPPPGPEIEIGEPTDLTVIPSHAEAALQPTVEPETEPTAMRAAVPVRPVEEMTPSDDWMMTAGVGGPTIAPREPPPSAVPPPARSERLTGDWSIQLDSQAPDGWSPPSKVEKLVTAPAPTGPPQSTVASVEPLVAKHPEPPGGRVAIEPKVQIDPTLIEPLQPMPADSNLFATLTPPVMPMAPMPMPPVQLPPLPPAMEAPPMGIQVAMHAPSGTYPAPSPEQLMTLAPPTGAHLAYAMPHTAGDSGASFFHEHAPPPQDSTSVLDIGRRKRIVVIAISAAVMVAIGIALLVMLGLDRDPEPVVMPVDQPVTQPVAQVPADAAVAAIVDAAAVVPDASAPKNACFVDVKSAPSGAEVMREGDRDNVLGTTPARLELPCGTTVKLVARKKGFANARETVTPTAKGAALRFAFAKNLMVVKVSSSPPGATILLGSKNLGITPGTIKLPAFETATITLEKAGYQVESRKIVPKANNTSVHAALTRKRK